MPKVMAEALPPGCPWSGWTPPNVDWCEEELCAWVVNPADTWSNLAYVLVGALMWQRARASGDGLLGLFGPAAVVVGVFSFAYHASYTYFLQFFDFVGMFLFCFTVITANGLRLGWFSNARRWHFLAAGTLVSSASVPIVAETSFPIQGLVGVLIAVILAQELALRGREVGARYGVLGAALALMALAAAFSAADVTRVWCDPSNHWLQGHALWHVFSAAALGTLYVFYEDLAKRGGIRP